MELVLPKVKRPELMLPSYVKLDMAFGVGSGSTLFDKSRYRSHGTIHGASWATGNHGYCLDFNPATPSYIEIPASYDQLDFTSEDFSFILRLYVDNFSASRGVCSNGQYAVGGYSFTVSQLGGDGYIFFATNQSGAAQETLSTIGSLPSGEWLTIGVSRDGSSIKFYQNGSETGYHSQGTHIDPASSSSSKFLIGSVQSGGSPTLPFDGKIEFCRIFGGIVLSASEHLAWHNALA